MLEVLGDLHLKAERRPALKLNTFRSRALPGLALATRRASSHGGRGKVAGDRAS